MTRTARWAMALLALTPALADAQTTQPATAPAREPVLSFQSGAAWHPRINVDADVAMVYGVTPTTRQRMRSWRDHGYTINLMTGVAWGEYQDYLFGRFDGQQHIDEAQTTVTGAKLGHGKDVYYMSPGPRTGRTSRRWSSRRSTTGPRRSTWRSPSSGRPPGTSRTSRSSGSSSTTSRGRRPTARSTPTTARQS